MARRLVPIRRLLRVSRDAAAIALAVSSCGQSRTVFDPPPVVALYPAFASLQFPFAVDLKQHPSDDHRWYVVKQSGVVETFLDTDPAATRTVAMTVPGLLTSGENGLLGMAFHPDFATNGELFLSYVVDTGATAGTSTIARYLSSDDGLTFVPDSDPQPIVLSLVQPYANHNGGDIDFGPDGFLYVAFGDGGGAGDPSGNGQDLDTWFGKILRLDVDSARPYAVPPDNPFVGGAGQDEIWAYGLRNPWRMSFDPATGALWAGDVGQATAEEIDVIVKGGNYGWSLQEGDLGFPSGKPSALPGLVPPVAVHYHPRCESITGGFVYHGSSVALLQGLYVYGDFETGRFYSLDPDTVGALPVQIHKAWLNAASFGQGRDGEIYVVAYGPGDPIYLIGPLP